MPGVGGGVAFGSSPSRARWVGVSAMSAISSVDFRRGRSAVIML